MELLFALLAVVAVAIFLTTPFWVAVGFAVVLAWTASLLYLIFCHPDPVSEAVTDLLSDE